MFIDEAVVTFESGRGGGGAATFRREKFVQFGGPSGGDGGDGGDVILEADININTLIDFRYQKKYSADSGSKGARNRMHGKSGKARIIKVPVGTMIRDFETKKLLMDLSEHGEKRLFLEGGQGGLGNFHFKNSTRKAPMLAQSGMPGKELKVKLELKLLADVALVGYPNVGKSSLINKISSAKSKVGNYHFTTIDPKLGVVKVEEEKSFVIADIPGLIDGAHEGVGLGYKFLRHIERCKIIYHLVDVSGIEGRDPIDDFEKINAELKNFSEKLYSKKQIVLANKMDLLNDEARYEKFKEYLDEKGIELYPVSVLLGKGLKPIIYKAYEELKTIERLPLEEENSIEDLFESRMIKEDWIIVKDEHGVYEVGGRIVSGLIEKYIFKMNEDTIANFLRILRNNGLEKELRKAGAIDGDSVRIAEIEFDFIE